MIPLRVFSGSSSKDIASDDPLIEFEFVINPGTMLRRGQLKAEW
jgi:hypothetical protein